MTSNKIQDTKSLSIKRALISVSNKDGIVEFATFLHNIGVEILSTGGTSKLLKENDIPVKDVSEETNFPEMMDGRIKTLHPKIHGGLLAVRDNEEHTASMDEHGINGIDLLVVNLYPFSETVEGGADFATCIENIDIGGPAMIRSAAKNHNFVTVITDSRDYKTVISELKDNDNQISLALRQRLAAEAFALTATYDANISSWFSSQIDLGHYPRRISFSATLKQELRYGENPHQNAALYVDTSKRSGVATASQIQGKELSYNNIADADAAYELVAEFEEPTVAIIKHANPCGVATGENTAEAYKKALACDPISAFGGIIALNKTLDLETAELILKRFCEVIIAPSVKANAMDLLKTKENVRVLTTGSLPKVQQKRHMLKTVSGGFLVQDADFGVLPSIDDLKIVSDREPTNEELKDLLFAFKVCKHVKSNAIVYAKNLSTVGIGAGQMSRIDSAAIAERKSLEAAKEQGLIDPLTRGSVVASDAFFPFPDGLLVAADAGATAVIQPGGSKKDQDVIDAANERGLAMVFTGMRHFRH